MWDDDDSWDDESENESFDDQIAEELRGFLGPQPRTTGADWSVSAWRIKVISPDVELWLTDNEDGSFSLLRRNWEEEDPELEIVEVQSWPVENLSEFKKMKRELSGWK